MVLRFRPTSKLTILPVLCLVSLLLVLLSCYYLGVDRLAIGLASSPIRSEAQQFVSSQSHIPPTSETSQTQVLIVTAFFPLPKSKHPIEKYHSWLSNFLKQIQTPIYFFTTPEMELTVKQLRGNLPITINTTFSTPFDIPPLLGREEDYNRMHAKDREKWRHNPGLYATWNAKPYFLAAGAANAQAAGQMYNYTFWNDAGSFRGEHLYRAWPSTSRVEQFWQTGAELSQTPQEDLMFYVTFNPPKSSARSWVEDDGPLDLRKDFSQGTWFGGSPKAVSWWSQAFYTYHDHYLEKGYFVGKDQTIFNALFLLFPERIITMWSDDPTAPSYVGLPGWPLGPCGPPWFYYQFFFASDDERDAMRNVWKFEITGFWSWFTDGYCRVAQVLSMKSMLRNQFGKGWIPPKRTVASPIKT